MACLRWASVGNDNVERGAVRGLGLMFLALFLLLKSRSFVVVQDLLFSTQSGCAGRWIKKPSARAGESDIEIFAIDSQAFAVDVGRTTRTPATAESPPGSLFCESDFGAGRQSPTLRYAFPSAASSRNSRSARKCELEFPSCAAFSPRGVFTVSIPSEITYDP